MASFVTTDCFIVLVMCLSNMDYLVSGSDIPVMEGSGIRMNVTAGMTAILPCMVDNIVDNKYQVVWMGPKKTTISLNTKRLTTDRRFSVSKPYDKDWNLHITAVRQSDTGVYRCFLNTLPLQDKTVRLNVVVPPRIRASSRVTAVEGQSVTVYCNVTGGIPVPTVTWTNSEGETVGTPGESLTIDVVTRSDAGSYHCQAQNGVAPSTDAVVAIEVHCGYPQMSISTTTKNPLKFWKF